MDQKEGVEMEILKGLKLFRRSLHRSFMRLLRRIRTSAAKCHQLQSIFNLGLGHSESSGTCVKE